MLNMKLSSAPPILKHGASPDATFLLREVIKNGQADRKVGRGGVISLGPDCYQMWKWSILALFDPLILKNTFHPFVWDLAFVMPF